MIQGQVIQHLTVKKIFTSEQALYDLLHSNYTFRDVEKENLAKILACRTSLLGCRSYCCENKTCSHTKVVCFSCKSRFCHSCGQKSTEQWIHYQGEVLPDCQFRHLTFTMPQEFWKIFQYNRFLLNVLFKIASRILMHFAKQKRLTPGLFLALHTYGRQLNFNVHIHLSIAQLALNSHGDLKPFSFPWKALEPMWRHAIINLLRINFHQLNAPLELTAEMTSYTTFNRFLDHHFNRRWNVNIAKKTQHKNQTKNYLGSYLKKPVVGNSRLKHLYGGDITFEYLDHRDKTYKNLTLSKVEMMLRLLSHIPEKYFKMVRYYGFLSNRTRGQLLPLVYEKLGQVCKGKTVLTYAAMLKRYVNIDPYECILCGSRMLFVEFEKGMKLSQLVSKLKQLSLQRLVMP